MPEQEFEIYLSLLSRLLRLNPAQKAAISDELRDHMEERLAQMIQSGVSRDEAIKIAMDEFGDVTGLALDLTKVSRTPLRKVVVRSTIAASCVAALIVGWVTLFVPEHKMASPLAVQAQPANEGSKRSGNHNPAPANSQRLVMDDTELFPEFLAKQADVEFTDIPLSDVCKFLQSEFETSVVINRSSLKNIGVSIDQNVGFTAKGLTFEEILNRVTRPLSLAWKVDGGIVQIVSADESRYSTRYYDLQKLRKMGHKLISLGDLVKLAADNWQEDGGEQATWAFVGESLAVRQTYQNHRRVAQILAAIEQEQPMTLLETCTNRDRLNQALQGSCSVELSETPLDDALKAIADDQQIPIILDFRTMSDEGISPDVPVSLTLKDAPLGKVLELLLEDHQLAYQIRDGAIEITTKTAADESLKLVVYNVRTVSMDEDFTENLSNAILRATNGKWMEIEGEGGELAQSGSVFLVKQSDRVQTEIQAMIEHMKRSWSGRAVEGATQSKRPKMITKSYRLPREIATDLQTALRNLVTPDSWKTINDENPTIELIAATPRMEAVDGLVSGGSDEIRIINQPVPVAIRPKDLKDKKDVKDANEGGNQDASMSTETPATAHSVPTPQGHTTTQSIVVRPRSMLVIRQTPEVHREIQKFLKNLEVVVEIASPQDNGGGGFRGGMMGGGMGGGGFF